MQAVGGILNPPSASNPDGSCAEANPNAVDRITRLGDVCVSVTASNWDCRVNEWAMQAGGYPNLCFRWVLACRASEGESEELQS